MPLCQNSYKAALCFFCSSFSFPRADPRENEGIIMAQTKTDTKLVLGVDVYDLVVLECAGQITAVNTRESQKIVWAPEVPARFWEGMHCVRTKPSVWHMEIKGSIW